MEKDYLENNTVDGNNPVNWEEIAKIDEKVFEENEK